MVCGEYIVAPPRFHVVERNPRRGVEVLKPKPNSKDRPNADRGATTEKKVTSRLVDTAAKEANPCVNA
jgi:hypothetical protein